MSLNRFALFGGPPVFSQPLPIGQLYFPSWERYETAFRGIFERQYYNNNGPLHEALEEKLQQYLGVKHVICVSNATFGLMMVADALGLTGKVILPAFTFAASAQSLSWAGLTPVFCDVDPETHQLDVHQVAALIDDEVSAIMGVNLWGGACNPAQLETLAHSSGVQLYFDSAHAFGCAVGGQKIGNFGQAEVFSFHATKILSATEGGCICTQDDGLAARLRSIRPSYGRSTPVDIMRVANARMSEAQAAIALMSLEDFPLNQANNAQLFRQYHQQLQGIAGIELLHPTGVSFSNYQYVVCKLDESQFGLSRNTLIAILKAENVIARRYFYPGLHRTIPYAQEYPQYLNQLPHTDRLCETSIQLPIGALVTGQSVEKICRIIRNAQLAAAEIAGVYEK